MSFLSFQDKKVWSNFPSWENVSVIAVVVGDWTDLWNVDTIDYATDDDGEAQDIFPTTAFYRDK